MVFSDRVEAGELLAEKLKKYQGKKAVIFALPRGGVITGSAISKKLNLPLDILIIRKIGHPANPEYALCASSLNHLVCDEKELESVDKAWFKEELERQKKRAEGQYLLYLGNKKPASAKGAVAIIVDDGIATGLTIKAAIREIKNQKPEKTIIAVPVTPENVARELENEVDEFITLNTPRFYAGSVGAYYDFFPQVTDEEVIQILSQDI